MIKELDLVVLTRHVPASGLQAGDIGTVVHRHAEGKAFEVEFAMSGGSTIDVLTLRADDLRLMRDTEILHARDLAPA